MKVAHKCIAGYALSLALLGGLAVSVNVIPISVATESDKSATPVYGYRVVNRYPHDPRAFTQGLLFHGGTFYESTGLYGESSVRQVEVETGKVIHMTTAPPRVFGEGLALAGDRLVQLTWQNHVAFAFDKTSFAFQGQFAVNTEGWGLTFDGKEFILSDGSDKLYFLDAQRFEVQRTIAVRDHERAIDSLNELEFVDGEIFANVWHSDRIARINPATGAVTGWIDLAGLRGAKEQQDQEAVLNGIAYDPSSKRLFVTGKRWATVFEIQVVAMSAK